MAVEAKNLESVAVEEETVGGKDGLTEPNISRESMNDLAADDQGSYNLVEFWGVRRPQLDIGGREIEHQGFVSSLRDDGRLSSLIEDLPGVLEF